MALEDIFAAAMVRLEPFERPPRLAIAVSGGADSLALLLLATQWVRARGGDLLALTVDHRLRSESAAEARHVAALAAARTIPHRILLLETQPRARGGLQATAREARYQALTQACFDAQILHLLTAHHQDDQAETFLLRLHRGSSPIGLSAMPPIRYFEHLRLLRPLLGIPKADLQHYCQAMGLTPLQDPSNDRIDFTRVRVRRMMAAMPDLFPPSRLTETAWQMLKLRQREERGIDRWLSRWVTPLPLGLARFPASALAAACAETRRRALGRLAAWAGGRLYPPRWEAFDGFETRLQRQKCLTLGGALWVARRGMIWLGRETAALAPTLDLPVARLSPRWDGRFRAMASEEGWQITALGRLRGLHLRRTPEFQRPPNRLLAEFAQAPAALLAGIPVFQRLDGSMQLPHLTKISANAPWLYAAPCRTLSAEGELGVDAEPERGHLTVEGKPLAGVGIGAARERIDPCE